MNGTIHIIGADRSEEWIDGENVKIVYRAGMDRDTWGHGAKIVFKDGEEMEFRNAIHVEVIPTPTETTQVTCDDNPLSLIRQFEEDNPPADYENDRLVDTVYNEMDRMETEERERQKREHPNWRSVHKNGNGVRFLNVAKANDIETVGQLLKVGRASFEKLRYMGRKCADEVSQALDNLYGIKQW